MSEVGLDGLPDGPPADGAGDWLLLEEGPLTVLADAEVTAGEDHNALLAVLGANSIENCGLSFGLKVASNQIDCLSSIFRYKQGISILK